MNFITFRVNDIIHFLYPSQSKSRGELRIKKYFWNKNKPFKTFSLP